jgi:hypothetical protein
VIRDRLGRSRGDADLVDVRDVLGHGRGLDVPDLREACLSESWPDEMREALTLAVVNSSTFMMSKRGSGGPGERWTVEGDAGEGSELIWRSKRLSTSSQLQRQRG